MATCFGNIKQSKETDKSTTELTVYTIIINKDDNDNLMTIETSRATDRYSSFFYLSFILPEIIMNSRQTVFTRYHPRHGHRVRMGFDILKGATSGS